MKTRIWSGLLAAIVVAFAFSAMAVFAEDYSSISATASAPQLTHGVANVLKLAQAKIGDEVIVSYVQNSGQSYGGLGASEIIHLHEQGISSRVITAMLDQDKKMRDVAAAQSVVQQTAGAQTISPTAPVIAAPQYQQTYVPPPVTYVQPSPTVIYMRDSSPRLVDYGIYPRHGRYYHGYHPYPKYGYHSYRYSHPSISFSFGHRGSPFHCW